MALEKSIRQRVDAINKQIENLQKEREYVQNECPHKNIKSVNYMYREGATLPADVCADCDKVIQFL